MTKKACKINIFIIFLFIFCSSCSNIVENCEIKPDLERIGKSVKENLDNLSETEWKSVNGVCNY